MPLVDPVLNSHFSVKKCEYLYDEVGIEGVFVYHIYEIID